MSCIWAAARTVRLLTSLIQGTRKSQTTKAATAPVKYCSDRCRHNKPSDAPSSVDRRITEAFTALLEGKAPSLDQSQDPVTLAEPPLPKTTKGTSKKIKGETRITVSCAQVETLVFGIRQDPEKAYGRKKNRARRGVPDAKEWKSVDMEDGDDTADGEFPILSLLEQLKHSYSYFHHAKANPLPPVAELFISSESEPETNADQSSDMIKLRVRPPQSQSEVNGSIGGEKGWAEKIEETPEMLQKRLDGQKRADERELVRCAARRLCAFGVVVDDPVVNGEAKTKGTKGKGKAKGKRQRGGNDSDDGGEQEHRKKCEAVMSGSVVEASYAKGEWGIRWRE